MKIASNIQQLWANLIVEELIRNGVDYFCVSPGSRSTPLALAVAQNTKAKSFIHFDERANAFHALGYAAAKKGKVAIITTSGTAVANLFPAIIEASKKKLPFIILTADRPVELRQTGANQTIDQVKIFGEYSRWDIDLCVPTFDILPNFVLSTIDQAVYRSKGELSGPVHINCMYREPFLIKDGVKKLNDYMQSLKEWNNSTDAFTQYESMMKDVSKLSLKKWSSVLNDSKKGLIVIGKLPTLKAQKEAVKLINKLNWPVLADITSGLRLGAASNNVIYYFDQLIKYVDFRPDTILHLGGRMTSKNYYQWIDSNPPQNYLMVLNHPLRNDPVHCVSHRLQISIEEFCIKIFKYIDQKSPVGLLEKLNKQDRYVHNLIEEACVNSEKLFEAAVCRKISQNIRKDHFLYISSSLPIREFDSYADKQGVSISIGANRGASGIDGTIASAVGYAKGLGQRGTLVIGDLAFLYDLNALSMIKELEFPMTIVVLNNDGGGIFEFLPVGKLNSKVSAYFKTPHGLNFKKAAELFNIRYANPATLKDFEEEYSLSIKSKVSSIIEINSDKKDNVQFQKHIEKNIQLKIKV